MRFLKVMPLLFLSGCSLITPAPQPRPPLQPYARQLNLAQTYDLCKIATVSVSVFGSPDDAERAIADKANRAGVRWYRIIMVSETVRPGRWYSEAVFYHTLAGSCTEPAAGPQR